MISIVQRGSFDKLSVFLKRANNREFYKRLERYAEKGVEALKTATPKRTGLTSESWTYDIKRGKDFIAIYWKNSNTNKGYNVALMLQYGHGLKNGGYVKGRDYINPAIKPIFDEIAEDIWMEVTKL